MGTYVVEQFGSESVDFEQLVGGDEAAQSFAVFDDTAGVGGADAVKQLQGGGVGAVELHRKWLADGRVTFGAVVAVEGVESQVGGLRAVLCGVGAVVLGGILTVVLGVVL